MRLQLEKRKKISVPPATFSRADIMSSKRYKSDVILKKELKEEHPKLEQFYSIYDYLENTEPKCERTARVGSN